MPNAARVYTVLVSGEPVFQGSYKSADKVWESLCRAFDVVLPGQKIPVTISFEPVRRLHQNGGELNV